jgi:hypothetical protein
MRGVALLSDGHQPQQVMVGLRPERFRAMAEIAQAVSGKDASGLIILQVRRASAAVFAFQFVQRGQGNPVSAVKVAENIKDLGFQLVAVSVRALGLGIPVWARGLRLRIGAYSFINSHGLPDLLSGELRLGRVRCATTGRVRWFWVLVLVLVLPNTNN